MGIVQDGNCPPGGNCPGWELSGMGIVRESCQRQGDNKLNQKNELNPVPVPITVVMKHKLMVTDT